VIYEDAKRSETGEQVPVLRWMIRQGGQTLHEILEQVDRGREALESVREAAGESLQQVQQRLDAQVRASIERLTSLPGLRQELQRAEENLRHLESQIGQLRRLASVDAENEEPAAPKRPRAPRAAAAGKSRRKPRAAPRA